MKNKWSDVVDRATKRLAEGYYPITVTDPWGGRGHDFRCHNEKIDVKGGLLLLVTSVPQEREWTQWKGRTARQDRKGQYDIILSREDAPFSGGGAIMKSCSDGMEQSASLVKALLKETDEANLKKLDEMKTGLDQGRHLAEVSDKYYQKFPRDDTVWPHPSHKERDRKLRDLLGSRPGVGEMRSFAAEMGLSIRF